MDRYPYLLTKEITNRKLYWYEWLNTIYVLNVIKIASMLMGEIDPAFIVGLMKNEMGVEFRRRATNSANHALFGELEYPGEFIFGNLGNNSISWLLKMRGELLYLNK